MAAHYEVGLHSGKVISQGLTTATTGNAQFVLKVKILNKVYDDGTFEVHPQQYDRTIYMTLTPKTIEYVVENLRQIGFTGTTMHQLDESVARKANVAYQSFVGREVDLWCKHEDDQKGGKREKWMISSGPIESKPLELIPVEAKKLRQLDALFGKALKDAPTPRGRVKPEDENQDAEPVSDYITDEDIPF